MQFADEFEGWQIKKHFTGREYDGLVVLDQLGGEICKIWFNHPFGLTEEQIRTNVLLKECIAGLISASPEMYQACKASLEYLTDRNSRVELGERAVELLRNIMAKISNPI